ncbi:hypothetical protein AB8T65_27290 [Klebsiella pneumoniae]|jgi:hypothetical protein|nr:MULTISPECIES: hypothetical protein [Klebsiella]EFK3693437.1 hypothetical protein [Escherichia coli]MBS6573024.1 hypothetical protein [Klebsiella michiganensis]HCA9797823.1 hypothetical protein [Klebsiella variicola subsp. variicola]HDT6511364.1 hypothetical protein [Klebsiella aerogenes]EIY5385430.1 hypothetical protein [Klebsiella variicola]
MANLKTKNSIRRQLRWLRNLREYCLDDREIVRFLSNEIRVLEKLLDDIVMEEYNPLSTRFDK